MLFDRLFPETVLADFAIIDAQFPQKEPLGFRNTEINTYLSQIGNAHAFTMYPMKPGQEAWFTHGYGQDERLFADNLRGYLSHHPDYAGRVSRLDPRARYQIKLAYSFFLAETYVLLPFLEKQKIPFVFVLYPGGAFGLHNPDSDTMLKRIFSSPFFREVIVTQRITSDYLASNHLCPPQKINYIYGGFVQFESTNLLPKIEYPKRKKTFDVAFVAAKYSDRGIDKGYDLFIDVAKHLSQANDNIHFHVVGGFGPSDIDVTEIASKVTFYGYQRPTFLQEFYSRMDILLSPNRPGQLFAGSFDGFPIGIDASYCGAALFVSDPLKMNEHYTNGLDIIILPLDPTKIAKAILKYYNCPEKLYKLARRGQIVTQRLFDTNTQIAKRMGVFRKYVELEPKR